jgi:hypothetical protein
MAIARMFEGKGWTAAQYDRLIERMNLDGRTAPGVLFHWAAETEDGIRAVDVYESREAADALVSERVAPLAQELGLPPPEISELEVRNYLTP